MIKINLVPREILDKELQKQRSVQIGIAAGLVALVFAGISATHYFKARRLKGELAEHEEKYKKLEKIVQQVEELEAQAGVVRSRLTVMQDLLIARPLYPVFMTELLKSLPEGIWLQSLDTAGSSELLDVNMVVQALTVDDVSKWLRTLETSDVFSGPNLGALNISAADGTLAFSMRVGYKPPKKETVQ